MPITISGQICIAAGCDHVDGWQWNLTEIDPSSVFGRTPVEWHPEWDSCDTGDMTPDQKFSYADFVYRGPLPTKLVNYLLAPDASEPSIEDASVEIENPTLTDIEYLERKLRRKFPVMSGDEKFVASLQFSPGKITESLRIEKGGISLIDEVVESEIQNNRINQVGTLFVSDQYGLSYMSRGKSREEIEVMVGLADADEMKSLAAYVASEFKDEAWGRTLRGKADQLLQEEIDNMWTPEEHAAHKEGADYAKKVGEQGRSGDCPYSADTEPNKHKAWVSGYFDYFFT